MSNNYLIVSEDPKQKELTLKKILTKIASPESEINYDLTESSITDILDEASMMSLLTPLKIIIGDNFDITKIDDESYDYLNKYLSSPNDSTYIILIAEKIDARLKSYKLIKEHFNIIETSKLDPREEIVEYIKKILKDNKYTMNDSAIEYLIDKTGNDINNIDSELKKLMIYKDDKTITTSDIELLVIDNIDNVIYEFTNAILGDDYDTITSMYDNFKIENIGADYLLVSIANVFRQSLIIKILNREGKSSYEIAKILGKKEFFIRKMLEKIYHYEEADFIKYISKLSSIDRRLKTGESSTDELIFFLLNKDS